MTTYASSDWRPKNTASATASGLRANRRSRAAGRAPGRAPGAAGTASQGRAVTSARTAHTPRAHRQPSSPIADAIGAAAVAATAPPRLSAAL
jgi:hypothetical protein